MNVIENNVVDNSQDTAPEPIIMKRDSAGNLVCFLLNTLQIGSDRNDGYIGVWHVGHSRDYSTVPLSYYHSSTKIESHEMKDLANKFASGWLPKFGVAIKHRLFKDAKSHHSYQGTPKSANESKRRSTDQKEVTFDKQLYVQKLQLALETSLRAAFKIVNEEMGVS